MKTLMHVVVVVFQATKGSELITASSIVLLDEEKQNCTGLKHRDGQRRGNRQAPKTSIDVLIGQ